MEAPAPPAATAGVPALDESGSGEMPPLDTAHSDAALAGAKAVIGRGVIIH